VSFLEELKLPIDKGQGLPAPNAALLSGAGLQNHGSGIGGSATSGTELLTSRMLGDTHQYASGMTLDSANGSPSPSKANSYDSK
jgi:hypothetical protein